MIMKAFFKYRAFILTSLALLGLSALAYPQHKKDKARLSLQYTKIMNKEAFIDISAKYKGDNGFEQVSGLELSVYKIGADDSLAYLEKVTTNTDGKTKFILKNDVLKDTKASIVFTYVVKIENNEKFEDENASVSFSDASLIVDLKIIDSVNQISARLTDGLGNPLKNQSLKVGLKRLYGSLQIGKDSYETDENGSILVPINEPMPGVDGILNFEVVLSESDTYGTIKAIVNTSTGTPIVEKSTFDQRTMWSPPNLTPVYLLIFPSLIIIGVWVPILILIFNLYKISKSKIHKL